MKTYRIFFWHGRNGKDDSLAVELSAFCDMDDEGELFFTGSLDDFAEKYGKHFIVKPQFSTPEKDWDDLICVTRYGSWGAR